MREYSYFLALLGGLLAFFSFGLPWDADHSGANLANSDGKILAVTVFIPFLVVFIFSVYILRRLSSWSYFAIISALIVSSIAHFLFIFPFSVFFAKTIFTQLNRLVGMVFVYTIVLGTIGLLIYCANKSLFQRYLRIIGALILGGIGFIICFALVLMNYEILNIAVNDHDSGINFILMSFFASLTIICVSIYRLLHRSKWKSLTSFFVIFCSSVGLICFLILFDGDSLDLKINRHYLSDPKYGAFLAAVGYIIAMVGVLCSNESVEKNKTDDTTAVVGNLD